MTQRAKPTRPGAQVPKTPVSPAAETRDGSIFFLNGQEQTLERPCSIADLCTRLGIGERGYAVECNGEVVPRSRWATVVVVPGDRVEIVHMVGGG